MPKQLRWPCSGWRRASRMDWASAARRAALALPEGLDDLALEALPLPTATGAGAQPATGRLEPRPPGAQARRRDVDAALAGVPGGPS
jgi:hypothetical protein